MSLEAKLIAGKSAAVLSHSTCFIIGLIEGRLEAMGEKNHETPYGAIFISNMMGSATWRLAEAQAKNSLQLPDQPTPLQGAAFGAFLGFVTALPTYYIGYSVGYGLTLLS